MEPSTWLYHTPRRSLKGWSLILNTPNGLQVTAMSEAQALQRLKKLDDSGLETRSQFPLRSPESPSSTHLDSA